MINKIKRIIFSPEERFNFLASKGLLKSMSDEEFLKRKWKLRLGSELNLDNPQTFNEKLQWLKLHNRKEIYTAMVDKSEVKKYVEKSISGGYIIPTLGVYDEFDDIDFGALPDQFVIKCTHDSGGVIVVKDKSKFSKRAAKKIINKTLERNYYNFNKEWPYKNVKPRIIIEKYMVDESGYELKDYKFFCFNGKVQYIQVDFDRFKEHRKNIYDRDWNFVDVEINYPNDKNRQIPKPKQLSKMIQLAEKLSENQPFLRVDLYSIKDKIYFGELTFYPGSGLMTFKPQEIDLTFGNMIELDKVGPITMKLPKERTMIIKGGGFIRFDESSNAYIYYYSYDGVTRRIRNIVRKSVFHFATPLFYGGWKKHLKDFEQIILFDSSIEDVEEITKYIKKNNPTAKIIFWYWNPIKSANDTALHDANIDEIWTYNRFDAKKYNLKYNPQFYYSVLTTKSQCPGTDMVFLGREKGREKILLDLKENAEKQGLKCDFILVKEKNEGIEYAEYLQHVFSSKCIVDLVANQNCGLTLRPLEALFCKKKLVTNYEDIVNYDFYDKQNIFLLGKDDINKLADFANSPYKEIDQKIVDFYGYEKWLERIEKGEDIKP